MTMRTRSDLNFLPPTTKDDSLETFILPFVMSKVFSRSILIVFYNLICSKIKSLVRHLALQRLVQLLPQQTPRRLIYRGRREKLMSCSRELYLMMWSMARQVCFIHFIKKALESKESRLIMQFISCCILTPFSVIKSSLTKFKLLIMYVYNSAVKSWFFKLQREAKIGLRNQGVREIGIKLVELQCSPNRWKWIFVHKLWTASKLGGGWLRKSWFH